MKHGRGSNNVSRDLRIRDEHDVDDDDDDNECVSRVIACAPVKLSL